jgi:hypothetical protein
MERRLGVAYCLVIFFSLGLMIAPAGWAAQRIFVCIPAIPGERKALTKIRAFRNKAGVPNRIRTGVADVKGRCPWPLDDGDATVINSN